MGGFNGSGTYVRYYNWTADASNAIPIMASRMDTEDNGFATALTNCITRDGQGVPSANISWNNHKLTSLSDAVDPQDALNQRSGDARYNALSYKSVKASTTSRNTTIILANDPDLITPTLIAGTYKVSGLIMFYADTGAGAVTGLKWIVNSSATITDSSFVANGIVNSVSNSYGITPSTSSFSFSNINGSGSAINTDWVLINGQMTISTSGTISFQWSQQTSNANNTNVRKGSYMIVEKIP